MSRAGCEEVEPELVDQTEPADVTDERTSGSDGGCGQGDEAAAEQNGERTVAISDPVAMGDIEHTLHGVRWSAGDEFFGPGEDERWHVLDIEVTNTGESSEVVSPMLMWTLIDEGNRTLRQDLASCVRGR